MKTLDKSNAELWTELAKRQARIEELELQVETLVKIDEEATRHRNELEENCKLLAISIDRRTAEAERYAEALREIVARDPEKLSCWLHRREQADEIARRALEGKT